MDGQGISALRAAGLPESEQAAAILLALASVWPAAMRLTPSVLGAAGEASPSDFIGNVQRLGDLGLVQYEACVGGVRPGASFRAAALTRRGLDLARRIAPEHGH